MRIGLDLDGVLLDSEKYFVASADLFAMENNKGTPLNKREVRVNKRFNWEEKTIKECANQYWLDIHRNAPFMPYAKEIFNKIKAMGHQFILITATGIWNYSAIAIIKQRLLQEGLVFDKLVFCAINKGKICLDEKIDIMIDDYAENIYSVANSGIKCLYYNDFNKDEISLQNVKSVSNWADILYEIKKAEIKD